MIRLAVLVIMLAVVAHPAEAQQLPPASDDPIGTAPIRFGAIALEPRFTVANVGVDTNVFNTRDNPQQDFTFTLIPGTQLWMRTGKGLLSLDAGAEFVYFNKFDTERSINSNASATYELRFNRIRPFISASTVNTRERPGYEIDARARHYQTDFHGGLNLRTGSKGEVRLDLRHLGISFAGDAFFAGRPLNQELSRTLKAADIGWHYRLTALTTWVVRVARQTERFEFDDARNADSFRVNTGFDLGRFALIRGSAFVGYRKLTAADGGQLPAFSGVTADVDVAYTAPTQTRLSAVVRRDIEYSYERTTPYYVQTGWIATLTQRVIGRWDVQVNGGRDRLSYQSLNTALTRLDFVGRVGGGVGYNLGERVRLGLDVQSFYRRSDLPGRDYGALRAGLTVTYGN